MSKTKKTNRTSLAPVASVTHPATQSPSSTSKHNNNNNRNYHSNTTQSTSYLPNYTTNLTLNPQLSNTSLNSTGSSSDQHSNKNGTVKTKKKFDKSQISGPTNFRVVQHVGLNNNNFEVIFIFILSPFFKILCRKLQKMKQLK